LQILRDRFDDGPVDARRKHVAAPCLGLRAVELRAGRAVAMPRRARGCLQQSSEQIGGCALAALTAAGLLDLLENRFGDRVADDGRMGVALNYPLAARPAFHPTLIAARPKLVVNVPD